MPKLVPKKVTPKEAVALRDTRTDGARYHQPAQTGEMIASDEKKLAAIKMRKEGRTIAEIAEELQITPGWAQTLITTVWGQLILNLTKLQADTLSEQLTLIEAIKLRLFAFITNPKIELITFSAEGGTITLEDFKGVTWATDRLVKVLEHEARLLGLLKTKDDDENKRGPATISREILLFVYQNVGEKPNKAKKAQAVEV